LRLNGEHIGLKTAPERHDAFTGNFGRTIKTVFAVKGIGPKRPLQRQKVWKY